MSGVLGVLWFMAGFEVLLVCLTSLFCGVGIIYYLC